MGVAEVVGSVEAIAAEWRADRASRQARRGLERADFDRLRDAGLLRLIVPADAGGFLESIEASARPLCETYRRLASADPSVALVSAMHPAVIAYWLASPDPSQPAWEEQRQAVFASASRGEQWGTVTSEPGSGGDVLRTRATAVPCDAAGFLPGRTYAVSGDKHFASGLGIADRMMTTAVPDGETEPAVFVLDVAHAPGDGGAGLKVVAEWDGMGMAATQSHAVRLDGAPAVRAEWGGSLEALMRAAGPVSGTLFTAVVLGVVDEAVAAARDEVRRRADRLRPSEQVEWTRAELDHWLAVQAYEGALRALEAGDRGAAAGPCLRAKQAVAELAEQVLLRLTRVLGGGTFSRRSPFAHWFEDVRALGFLRPPWGLASDLLFTESLG